MHAPVKAQVRLHGLATFLRSFHIEGSLMKELGVHGVSLSPEVRASKYVRERCEQSVPTRRPDVTFYLVL